MPVDLSSCPLCPDVARDAAVLDLPRTCAAPGCRRVWVPELGATVRTPDPVGDLEALAAYLPHLTGSALAPGLVVGDGNRGGSRPNALNGRSDWLDAHHRGLRRAAWALGVLDALERAGQRAHVAVLWYAHVVCGPELVRTHLGGRHDLVAARFAPRARLAFWRTHKARVVARREREAFGAALLGAACEAYAAAARARQAPPRHAPVARALDDALAHALARGRVDFSPDSPESPDPPATAVDPLESPAHPRIADGRSAPDGR